MLHELNERIAAHPDFIAMQRRRKTLSAVLSIIILFAYYFFITLVAFFPTILSVPVDQGWTITWGIVLGVFVIVLSIALTGLYIHKANTVYDRITNDVIREIECNGAR